MNPFKKPVDSVSLSLPEPRKVRGYAIRRMPLGAYLAAMKSLNTFPARMIDGVFPGMSLEDILLTLKECNADTIGQMLIRAIGVLPEETIGLVAQLTGIPNEELLADEAIGLDGLLEIIGAWIEVNGLENFTNAAAALWKKVKGMAAASTGSKD